MCVEWERNIYQIFLFYGLSELDIITMASLEFKDSTLFWWNQVKKDIKNGRREIVTLVDLKDCMRSIFVPFFFKSKIILKYQKRKRV